MEQNSHTLHLSPFLYQPITFPLSYTFFSFCFFLRSIIHYFFLSARNFLFFPFSFFFYYFFCVSISKFFTIFLSLNIIVISDGDDGHLMIVERPWWLEGRCRGIFE